MGQATGLSRTGGYSCLRLFSGEHRANAKEIPATCPEQDPSAAITSRRLLPVPAQESNGLWHAGHLWGPTSEPSILHQYLLPGELPPLDTRTPLRGGSPPEENETAAPPRDQALAQDAWSRRLEPLGATMN